MTSGAASNPRKRDRLRARLLPTRGTGASLNGNQTPPSQPLQPISSSSLSRSSVSPNPTSSSTQPADGFLSDALGHLSSQARDTISKYIPKGSDDINSALRSAYVAATDKREQCAAKRWTWTYRGRAVSLRDEADKVMSFLDRVKSVGDVAVNADPIHAGLPWAGVRLMLEIAVAESHQMAALLAGLNTTLYMADRLRVYFSFFTQLPSSDATSNFRNALINFYAIILGFLADAIESLRKSTPARALEAVWSPQNYEHFETKCDRIEQRTEIEARNCDRERHERERGYNRQCMEEVQRQLNRLEELQTNQAPVYRLRDNVDLGKLPVATGAAFDSNEEGDRPRCLKETRIELLQQIEQWVEDPNGKLIFWLKGAAGTGKSTISRTVAQRLKERGQLGASFFFKRGAGDRSNAHRFFTTMASQLAENLPSLRSIVADVLDTHLSIPHKSLEEQFKKLILEPLCGASGKLPTPATVILVIDALDECESEQDVKRILRQLERAKITTALRILVTSRPDLPVLLGFEGIEDETHEDIVLHEIDPSIIEHDITFYLEHQFAEIRMQRSQRRRCEALPADWPGEKDLRTVVALAVPLFIVAATIIRFVQEPRAIPQDRLSSLLASPKLISSTKLDDTYSPVLNQLIAEQDPTDQKEFVRDFIEILGPVVTLAEPLSVCSISRLLKIPQARVSHRLDWLHSVLDIPEDETLPVRLYHLSFREFLFDTNKRGKSPFWVDEQEMHAMLANKCLELLFQPEHLKRDLCGLRDWGVERTMVSHETIANALPLDISYACRYWVFHLEKSELRPLNVSYVDAFLRKHLLHWLEALSWLGRLSESIAQIKTLHALAEQGTELSKFLDDAKRFILQHQSMIDFAPLQLYSSALIFAPSASVVKATFKRTTSIGLSIIPQLPRHWGFELQKLESHESGVRAVAFSHDGQLLASASNDGMVRLWNPITGEQSQKLEGHRDWVSAVTFSRDGQLLASASNDRTVRLWNPTTGEEVMRLKGHQGWVVAVAFSRDGQLLASASNDGTFILWNLTTGEEVLEHAGHKSWISAVAFSLDDQLLVSTSDDRTVRLWNPMMGEEGQTLEGHNSKVIAVAFSHDGQLFASASNDGIIRLWNPTTGEEVQKLEGHQSGVTTVTFSSDGRLLASASDDRTIRVWDLTTGEEVQKLEGHESGVSAVTFSRDGQLLASASNDQTVRLWEPMMSEKATIGEEFQGLIGHEDRVRAVVFSHDGQLLASMSDDRTIRLWDPTTGKDARRLVGHEDSVVAVAFSRNSQLLASASKDRTVRLWNPTTGEEVQKLDSHEDLVVAVAFSHDNQWLAVASSNGTVRLWNPTTGDEVQKLEGNKAWVTAIAFSRDDQLLAVASSDSIVMLWNLTTGEEVRKPEGYRGGVIATSFSNDSQFLAFTPLDGTVRIWNVTIGEEVQKLVGHKSLVRAVAFSRDDQLLASASDDRTVRLWNPTTGQELQKLEDLLFQSISFSPDSKYLLSDIGRFSIDYRLQKSPAIVLPSSSCRLNRRWIEYQGKRLLWLPHGFRPTCSASHGNCLILGHASGRITFLRDPSSACQLV